MSKEKNYFFRVNPNEVLAELTTLNPDEWLKFLLNFFHDLRNDDAVIARTDLSRRTIEESHNFRQLRSNAGKKSAEQRANSTRHMLDICLTELQQTSTSSSNSSSSSIKDTNPLSGKPDIPYQQILDDMNRILGTKCRLADAFKKLVKARFNDGMKPEDFSTVCEHKKKEWGNNPDMRQYLRPSTLFGVKMNDYLGVCNLPLMRASTTPTPQYANADSRFRE